MSIQTPRRPTLMIATEWFHRWPGHTRRFWTYVAKRRKDRKIKLHDYEKIGQIVREIEKEFPNV